MRLVWRHSTSSVRGHAEDLQKAPEKGSFRCRSADVSPSHQSLRSTAPRVPVGAAQRVCEPFHQVCCSFDVSRRSLTCAFCSSAINVALQIAYGYEGVTEDKGLIAMAVEAMNIFSTATIPGAWLVDTVSPREQSARNLSHTY